MTIVLRFVAWGLAAGVAFATLGPPHYRPRADLGQVGEHAVAFILVGFAFGLAYRHNRTLTALLAIALIGAIEILQIWAPGRHARLSDFFVGALAACAGLAIVVAFEFIVGCTRRPRS